MNALKPENRARFLLLLLVLILILLGISYLDSYRAATAPGNATSTSIANKLSHEEKALKYSAAAEIANPSGFINSGPFKLKDYVGKKVILVDFWTYSCINCQRTIPYLNAWQKKYGDKGLLIVGVHTPEFAFEKDRENVLNAVNKLGIRYPVVQDNNNSTWNAYENRYWPHEFLIDIDGYVVHDSIGEGNYALTEQKIQELLGERKERLGLTDAVPTGFVLPDGVIPIDPKGVQSPETYFGALRNEFLGNGTQHTSGIQTLTLPDRIQSNQVYLSGNWGFRDDFAYNTKAPAKIVYKYSAKNVYLVGSADQPVRVKVTLDGKVVKTITIKDDQLYPIIEGTEYGEHTLELDVLDPVLHAFTFTFG